MNWIARTALAICIAASLFALTRTIQFVRGDLIIFSVPRADAETKRAKAARLQNEIRRGLLLSPYTWQGRVKNASYLAVQQKFDLALEELNKAYRFNLPMQGLMLEATTLAHMGKMTEAIEKFERVRRISVLNRAAIQHLLRLYNDAGETDKLSDLAIESDMRWPFTFDSQVALANSHMRHSDVPIIMKYLILAEHYPRGAFYRPEPKAFEYKDVTDRLAIASDMLGSDNDWSQYP